MVEGVHRRSCCRMTRQAVGHQRLDTRSFYFHVYSDPAGSQLQHCIQRWNGFSIGEPNARERCVICCADGYAVTVAPGLRLWGFHRYVSVMVNHHNSVARGMHVQLESVRPLAERFEEGRHGVFQAVSGCATMGNDFEGGEMSHANVEAYGEVVPERRAGPSATWQGRTTERSIRESEQNVLTKFPALRPISRRP